MNRLKTRHRVEVLKLLVEGNTSINFTANHVGVSKNTILKLITDVGKVSLAFQDKMLRNLKLEKVQCDELWAFCYCKKKNLPKIKRKVEGAGDAWTWTAICPDTKLVPCWLVGKRTATDAKTFMMDLASRLTGRVQLTTDGFRSYPEAVEYAFGEEVDFGSIVKTYGKKEGEDGQKVLDIQIVSVLGSPDEEHISTSLIERQNLTMCMSMRRFSRKTNAHSKKLANHKASVAMHFMWYNFIRTHETLKTTPAIAAGVTRKQWTWQNVLSLMS